MKQYSFLALLGLALLSFFFFNKDRETLASRPVDAGPGLVTAPPSKALAPKYREGLEACGDDPWCCVSILELWLGFGMLEEPQKSLIEEELAKYQGVVTRWEGELRDKVCDPLERGDLESANEGLRELKKMKPPAYIVRRAEAKLPQPPDIDGLDWVYIPGGRYWIGTPDDQKDVPHLDTRHDPRKIEVEEGYFISTTEVPQGVYRRYDTDADWSGSRFCGDDYPAHSVNQEEIEGLLELLGRDHPEHIFSIPLETEWEVAANGQISSIGDMHPFSVQPKHIGRFKKDQTHLMKVYGWISENSKGELHPVGQKQPNRIGLYDMVGNVMEWCMPDEENFGLTSKGNTANLVTKGGSYQSKFESACCSSRTWNRYDEEKASIGFRLICRIN